MYPVANIDIDKYFTELKKKISGSRENFADVITFPRKTRPANVKVGTFIM